MTQLFVQFVRNDDGQDLIEYGLLLGIIAVGVAVTVTNIGGAVKTLFDTVCGSLPGCVAG